jgi:CheY-like chemotaxis protein
MLAFRSFPYQGHYYSVDKPSGDMKTLNVLIVDDSDDGRLVLRDNLNHVPRFIVVGELCDGEDAIAYLSGQTIFADRQKYPFPDLMLLDLNLPRKSGFDVLRWLRTQPFTSLVTIVVSGSTLEIDAAASFALGAHGFWTKMPRAEKHKSIAQEIEELFYKHCPAPATSTINNYA